MDSPIAVAAMPLAVRFDRNTACLPDLPGCWLWTGSCLPNGYGLISVQGTYRLAHRQSYETFVGPIPPGLCVLHHCDTPSCVRPDHLFLGTTADNYWDSARKGRATRLRGSRHQNAKLTEADVREIRQLAVNGGRGIVTALANRFHVGYRTIGRVIQRTRWGHL
jgi:HNH endonuclease